MLPLSEMLTVCGYEADVDEKNKTMKTKIGNTAVVLDAKTSTVSIDTTKIKLLVEPIFKDGQCYVSFNDLKNFIMIKHPDDAKNVSFFWESSETNELENKLKTLPTKHIYELTVRILIHITKMMSLTKSLVLYTKKLNT